MRADGLPNAVAQVESLYLEGRLPGMTPQARSVELEPGRSVTLTGTGGDGPHGIVDGSGDLLTRLRVIRPEGGTRHPQSFDEAAGVARSAFATGDLGRFGLTPTPQAPAATEFPDIPDPWEPTPEPMPAPTPDPTPARPFVPLQRLLTGTPERPLLPPAGGTSGSDVEPATGTEAGDGGDGGVTGVAAAGAPEEPEEPEENLDPLREWLKTSARNWEALRGNAVERALEFRQLLAGTIKTVGTGLAVTNGIGAAGGAIFYGGLREQRTGDTVTAENATSELAKLQENPLAYLENNYDNAVAGINVGDRLYNMSGNLLEVTEADGSLYHFRRVPEDLFNALRDARQARGVGSEQVFVQEEFRRPDGTLETLDVEIRPPFRAEPLRDAQFSAGLAEGSQPLSFGFQGGVRFGPVEGQTFNAQVDAFLNYRYQGPTISTVRVGVAPPSGGNFGVGIRQQDSTIWNRLGVGASAIDINPGQVRDLTDPTSPFNDSRLQLANGRVYIDMGNRNRVRLDAGTNANTLAGNVDSVYARARETGFLEIGLGADFLRFTRGDDWVSTNFYNELELYAPDLRGQANVFGSAEDFRRNVQGGLKPSPLFEVDQGFQFSTNMAPRITPATPGLTADPLRMNTDVTRPFAPTGAPPWRFQGPVLPDFLGPPLPEPAPAQTPTPPPTLQPGEDPNRGPARLVP